jgi:hypothetical protein
MRKKIKSGAGGVLIFAGFLAFIAFIGLMGELEDCETGISWAECWAFLDSSIVHLGLVSSGALVAASLLTIWTSEVLEQRALRNTVRRLLALEPQRSWSEWPLPAPESFVLLQGVDSAKGDAFKMGLLQLVAMGVLTTEGQDTALVRGPAGVTSPAGSNGPATTLAASETGASPVAGPAEGPSTINLPPAVTGSLAPIFGLWVAASESLASSEPVVTKWQPRPLSPPQEELQPSVVTNWQPRPLSPPQEDAAYSGQATSHETQTSSALGAVLNRGWAPSGGPDGPGRQGAHEIDKRSRRDQGRY